MTPSSGDQQWQERTGVAVRAVAPDVPELTAEEKAALWERIEVSPEAGNKQGRVGWRAVVAGAVVMVAVGGAGVATAGVFSARTGQGPVDAEDLELGGPGERLNPAAPDFAQVIDEETADIRFPSPESRARSIAWESNDYDDGTGASVATGAIRLWMAGHALCAWTDEWAAALRAGDTEAEQKAADVILDARTWPAITDTDPDMANESEFDWLPDLERAIEADDPSAAREALYPNQSCMPGLAPELGLGEPQ